jgi:DNA-binding XRE family transcriptional regulator
MLYSPLMSDYDEEVKRLQAEAWTKLQKLLAESNPDPFRLERRMLGHDLARARIDRRLSQEQLANKVRADQSAISRIENGRGNPSLNTLLKIAKTLDVNLVVEY